jgi:prepilin-type processing-associated H-X9-DG protein
MDFIWRDYLNQDIAAMECPAQQSQRPASMTYNYLGPQGYRRFYPGYMVNRYVMWERPAGVVSPTGQASTKHFTPRRVDDFVDPLNKILMADSGLRLTAYPNVGEGWAPITAINAAGAQGGSAGCGLSGRHNQIAGAIFSAAVPTNPTGGSNLYYFDGHANYGDWITHQPWDSSNWNPQNLAGRNQGLDISKMYWDPEGDGLPYYPW